MQSFCGAFAGWNGGAVISTGQLEAWADQLLSAARRGCHSAELRAASGAVDDVLQETLLIVWRNAHRLDPDTDRLCRWTWRVARNLARRVQKFGRRREITGVDPDLLDELLDDLPDVESRVVLEQESQKLLDALRFYVKHAVEQMSTLGQRRRALRNTFILARHFLRGQPNTAIAGELDMTADACLKAAEKARSDLRQFFDAKTGELKPAVVNSSHFRSVSEVSEFLRTRLGL
jgi:RNA polymerase sigma factor (sigma-70 family)